MNNPLESFRRNMIDFEIYRDGKLISTSKGLKNSYQGKDFIQFFPDVDVQPGDILKCRNINFYITNYIIVL